MSGTVKDEPKLKTRTSRAKLKSKLKDGRVVRWRDLNLSVGGITKAHLGYQRWLEDKSGRWVLRTYRKGKYTIQPLGLADDVEDGDGLSLEAAEAMARELLAAPVKKNKKLTVAQAMLDYIADKERKGQPTKDLMSRSRAHIETAPIGNYLVSELTADVIRSWHAGLANQRAMVRSRKGDQRYKPMPTEDEGVRRRRNSANRVMAMLKAALNFAYDEDRVASREQWGRKVKPFKKASDAIRWPPAWHGQSQKSFLLSRCLRRRAVFHPCMSLIGPNVGRSGHFAGSVDLCANEVGKFGG